MSYSYTDLCGLMDGCHEAITHLASAGSDESFRTLIAATRTTIYSSNDRTGNWRVLADGLGGGFDEETCNTCSSRRFRSTQLGNYILFTNNFDPVLAWKFGDPPTGLSLWSAQHVEDLLIVGITRARAITTFNGFVIVGNVDIEGQHKGARIYWSDYNNPLSWIPSDFSLASYQEFELGENVLRMEGLGKYLMVYTDKAVYQGVYVGGDLVFQFQRIPTDSPLVYEHSLVNIGNAHIYASHSGLYVVTASDPRPSRYEWTHKASGSIYSGIGANILGGFIGLAPFGPVNQEECEQFIGGFNQITEEVWFSWPTDDNTCPNMSLVLNLRCNAADLVDHGFTAFVNYKPDYRPIVRDWLTSEGICTPVVSDYIKEGLPLDTEPEDTPLYLWNPDEDPTLAIHPDSWCARLGDTTVDDLCSACDSSPLFLMGDAQDFTIKEADPGTFMRETYNSESGTWSSGGYYTALQSDLMKFGVDEDKVIKMITCDFQAEESEPINDLYCEVGNAAQPRCSFWHESEPVELRCLTDEDLQGHEYNNTRPNENAKYMFWRRGRYIGYRLFIAGTGGSACLSRVELVVSKANARTH